MRYFKHFLAGVVTTAVSTVIDAKLITIKDRLRRIENIMSENQEQLDALTSQIGQATDIITTGFADTISAITAETAQIENFIRENGESIDLSALQGVAARLGVAATNVGDLSHRISDIFEEPETGDGEPIDPFLGQPTDDATPVNGDANGPVDAGTPVDAEPVLGEAVEDDDDDEDEDEDDLDDDDEEDDDEEDDDQAALPTV